MFLELQNMFVWKTYSGSPMDFPTLGTSCPPSRERKASKNVVWCVEIFYSQMGSISIFPRITTMRSSGLVDRDSLAAA